MMSGVGGAIRKFYMEQTTMKEMVGKVGEVEYGRTQ